ncbi:universal stress protein [Fulvivirga sp. M361]|uniref:universal stress protein n=1 Tax=Fulvivirga sp. M361 TaxID=2594266 RepID=UPI00117B5C1C|nr:universal stress protein [Fulvivirga sp. M361]TRX52677.1 universal stress protein [Fulvivirga sp. M361]
MQLFQRILYPTDFSDNSIESMNYAMKVCKTHDAELFILYSYRLNNNGNSDGISHRNNLAHIGREEFEKVNKELLSTSGVKYSFSSEIGFIVDRILANTLDSKVDLIVLCDNMLRKIEQKPEKGKEKLLKRINCPVMFVPPELVAPSEFTKLQA